MDIFKDVIDYIFGAALFLNAILFIPQAVRIFKEKTSEGVSLITFFGFLAIQLAIIFHAAISHDYLLMNGYIFSFAACATVTTLAVIYRKKGNRSDDISLEEVFAQLPTHIYWKNNRFELMGCNTNNWKDFGFKSLNAVIGKTEYDLFAKDISDRVRFFDEMVLKENTEKTAEEVFIDEKGRKSIYLSTKKPLIDKKGKVIGILGSSIDITLSKEEILNQLAMLDNIISVMPGNVYWMNKNGVYLGCNDNEVAAVGLASRQDIVGKKNIDIPGFVMPEALDPLNEEVLEKGRSITVEEPAILRDGSQAVFLSKKVPIHDSHGEIAGLVGISFDITEKKKAEQDLILAKEAAEAANRAKTEFLANMSHDVKTPLSGVIGMADLMIGDSVGQEKKRAEAIYACGMQLLSFFNSCLDLSKLEMAGWMSTEEVFSLEKMLHEIGALFSPSAQMKGLDLMVDADPALPLAVRTHRASVYRVLLNLVGNALKFTPKGSVLVRGFLVEKVSPNQVCVGLEVKDTGIGIPEDQQDIIFEKMRRLTPAYEGKIEGSGIGLYIVDQYVKRMGGKIQVKSTVGVGSAFTVFLTMTVASENELRDQEELAGFLPSYMARPVVAPTEEKSVLPENAPRILLVEDNSLIQHVTQSLLNGAGFQVDVAGTGAEALAKFSPGKYRLIYMDIGLPDQDGYSVAHAIREKEKSLATPIIALTAHGALDVERFCSRAGMQGVLSKPLTREQATSVWERYGLGKSEKVDGLTMIENTDKTPVASQIIDIKGTASLLGSKDRAKELLTLWFEMLTKRFLPALHDLISKHDIEGLRHELHAMLGSLCYVKTPLLNQALLELQTATRNHPQEIENAYQRVLQESQRFIDQYQKQLISKSH